MIKNNTISIIKKNYLINDLNDTQIHKEIDNNDTNHEINNSLTENLNKQINLNTNNINLTTTDKIIIDNNNSVNTNIVHKSQNEIIETKNTNNCNKIINCKKETIDKNRNYYKLLFSYFIYLLVGFIGGIFINLISGVNMINFDMLFNIIISPILYYHSPRNILMNIDKINLIKYYFIPFFIGLMFRFFDKIPGFSQFILDPYYIKSTLQITLLIVVLTIIISLSIYYIYISSNPILNTILFFCEIILTVISCYFYLLNNGNIHIHHYFIGLIIMLVSKNYHSKIVVMAHAISYAIYIEGISAYGFDAIYWK